MIGFCPLASGSKGNALFLGSQDKKFLIDVGISLKKLKEKLGEIGVTIDEIDAILITHEHSDHIKGLEKLTEIWKKPIFCNRETAKVLLCSVKSDLNLKIFSSSEPFSFGDIDVFPFSIEHDTVDPVGFVFKVEGFKVSVCADLGFAGTFVQRALHDSDILYLESNHEENMVHACARPSVYKRRVLSRLGHLSNDACNTLLAQVMTNRLKCVYLAHLSSECNSEELAYKKAVHTLKNTQDVKLYIAHQSKVSIPFSFVEAAGAV
ncbi:Zn-dependent hydrolase [Candidatus Aerophobetes bacterium]|uniref:Zn-dependent hydrolase n=1 Tax=Aerophobetes bacterium TaxID=2030807 RepID=A0A2A4X1G6_UNCAE|nr:MAG: Zn-dependent hydrolase [Candidatus Aerophobetes bacterium]